MWLTILCVDSHAQVAKQPFKLTDSYTAPKGSFIVPSIWAAAMHGYEDATRFDPDRFGPERQEDIKFANNFLVFGWGPHYCIGKEVHENYVLGVAGRVQGGKRIDLGCLGGEWMNAVIEPFTETFSPFVLLDESSQSRFVAVMTSPLLVIGLMTVCNAGDMICSPGVLCDDAPPQYELWFTSHCNRPWMQNP